MLEIISCTAPLTSLSLKKELLSYKDPFCQSLSTCSIQPSHFNSVISEHKYTVQTQCSESKIHNFKFLSDKPLSCACTVRPAVCKCMTFISNLLASVLSQSVCKGLLFHVATGSGVSIRKNERGCGQFLQGINQNFQIKKFSWSSI